jgi:hypothetical protein
MRKEVFASNLPSIIVKVRMPARHLATCRPPRNSQFVVGVGIVLGLVFCYQSAVAMRLGARLARAEFTLLSRSGSTGRTSDSE